MKGAVKTFLVDNVPTEFTETTRGTSYVWAVDKKGTTHTLSKVFWAGLVGSYRANGVLYELPVGKDPSLIQRIEYALHSRYDADNRQLLEEALAVLKEKA